MPYIEGVRGVYAIYISTFEVSSNLRIRGKQKIRVSPTRIFCHSDPTFLDKLENIPKNRQNRRRNVVFKITTFIYERS